MDSKDEKQTDGTGKEMSTDVDKTAVSIRSNSLDAKEAFIEEESVEKTMESKSEDDEISLVHDDSTSDADVEPVDSMESEVDHPSKGSDAIESSSGMTLRSFFSGKRLIVIVIIFAVAIIAPALWAAKLQFLFDRKPLSNVDEDIPIVMYDHSWDKTKLDSDAVDGIKVNTTQYIMHYSDKSRSCFTFKGRGQNPKHTIKISMSIGEEKSRDFLNAQANPLVYGMRRGTIAVQVCPLLNEDEYSAFATEALSEVDWNNSSNTWNALTKLSLVDTSELTTTDARIKSILKTVSTIKDAGKKTSIQEASIKNGSFMQNARKVSNENTAEAIPAIWSDGRNVTNGSAFRLYDYQSLYDYLNTLK